MVISTWMIFDGKSEQVFEKKMRKRKRCGARERELTQGKDETTMRNVVTEIRGSR